MPPRNNLHIGRIGVMWSFAWIDLGASQDEESPSKVQDVGSSQVSMARNKMSFVRSALFRAWVLRDT